MDSRQGRDAPIGPPGLPNRLRAPIWRHAASVLQPRRGKSRHTAPRRGIMADRSDDLSRPCCGAASAKQRAPCQQSVTKPPTPVSCAIPLCICPFNLHSQNKTGQRGGKLTRPARIRPPDDGNAAGGLDAHLGVPEDEASEIEAGRDVGQQSRLDRVQVVDKAHEHEAVSGAERRRFLRHVYARIVEAGRTVEYFRHLPMRLTRAFACNTLDDGDQFVAIVATMIVLCCRNTPRVLLPSQNHASLYC